MSDIINILEQHKKEIDERNYNGMDEYDNGLSAGLSIAIREIKSDKPKCDKCGKEATQKSFSGRYYCDECANYLTKLS